MSQIFDLCVATETLTDDAQQLSVTVEDLERINVQVSAVVIKQPEPYLHLQYRVTLPSESLAAQLDWPKWQSEQVTFTDYLWEQTCLECFLAASLTINNDSKENGKTDDTVKTMSYIEINASPSGQYALYKFDRYRYPATLPPQPLFQSDNQTRATVDWIISNDYSESFKDSKRLVNQPYQYQRGFKVLLAPWHNKADCSDDDFITHIHPCVILYFGDTALYFAPKHASPPDFHNRQYWTRFDRQEALGQQKDKDIK